MNFANPPRWTWSASFPIQRAVRARGAPRRKPPSTARRPAISSCISIAFSIPRAWRERRPDFKMIKRLWRLSFVQEAVSVLLVAYIRLVRITNRFTVEPADADGMIEGNTPLIVAMWHGQHFMMTFAWHRSIARVAALISRHGDAGISAAAHRRLGVEAIRGSGGRAERMRDKGGVPALRGLLRALESGASVVITPDLPHLARVAGEGLLALARLSGR